MTICMPAMIMDEDDIESASFNGECTGLKEPFYITGCF